MYVSVGFLEEEIDPLGPEDEQQWASKESGRRMFQSARAKALRQEKAQHSRDADAVQRA